MENFSDMLVDVCSKEFKKKEVKDKIMKEIMDPLAMEVATRYYPYFIAIILILLIIMVLLSVSISVRMTENVLLSKLQTTE